MSSARRQVMVDAPIERVWELIGNVNRHPEWWPRVEEVECDVLQQGCTYREVTRKPMQTIETTISIERLEECQELRIRCLDTGTCAAFVLQEAQEGTFVDAEISVRDPGLYKLVGAPFVRRWLAQSLASLQRAATSGQQPGDRGGERGPGDDPEQDPAPGVAR